MDKIQREQIENKTTEREKIEMWKAKGKKWKETKI